MRHWCGRALGIIVVALIASSTAIGFVGDRDASSMQGGDAFTLSATDRAVDPTTGMATVTVSVVPRAEVPAAVRGVVNFDGQVASLFDCRPLVTWVACDETTPGQVVFEAVTATEWNTSTALLELVFDAASLHGPALLDVEVDAGLSASATPLSAAAADASIEPHRAGDVNCGASTDVIDALLIARYTVGLQTGVDGCPGDEGAELFLDGGDIDHSGSTDIIDALVIMRCTVGIDDRGWCP